MTESNAQSLANEFSIMAVRLVRWLRAADPSPALSGPEASAMAVIVYTGGATPSRLAELEQVRRPTISRVLEGLENRGFVRRDVDPDDKRSSIISPTRQGMELWQAGQLRRVAPLAKRIAALDADERQQLVAIMPLLSKLTDPYLDTKAG